MPILVGLILALVVVVALGQIIGFGRDRAFYPVVLIIVASYYLLFAVMAGGDGLVGELVVFALFAAAAILGFRISLWFAAAGLALHGLFDFTRHWFLAGHGVPLWWPDFCGAFDILAGAGLAMILLLEKHRSASSNSV
jgi:hypothetical protein